MTTELQNQQSDDMRQGLVTQPHRTENATVLIEQERAIAEVKAELTVAMANPREEEECRQAILISCQRQGLAESATYVYSRGGTEVTGPSIRLMETIAQKWRNVDWGFRELSRHDGTAGRAGRSVVEAFAWDKQTNSRVKRSFTVEHRMGLKGGNFKILTDPRDIYEWIANNAQRRVRTCLENIIPRDIWEEAVAECDKTLKTKVKITPENVKAMLDAFEKFHVTKEMVEKKIQRNLESLTAAQFLWLRKVYRSLDEGMSTIENWFEVPEAAGEGSSAKTATESAKEALRKSMAENGGGNGAGAGDSEIPPDGDRKARPLKGQKQFDQKPAGEKDKPAEREAGQEG